MAPRRSLWFLLPLLQALAVNRISIEEKIFEKEGLVSVKSVVVASIIPLLLLQFG